MDQIVVKIRVLNQEKNSDQHYGKIPDQDLNHDLQNTSK